MGLTRPLLIGRGPFAQKIYAALPRGVQATIDGRPTCMESIREARARGNDCVIIASRTDSHAELLKAAFEQKLPVFCEKPLCMSVSEAESVEFTWKLHGEPPFLCDFLHLWTVGFDYAWPRYSVKKGIEPAQLTMVFGGDVQRKDIHPVWDYGSHGIALALMLGYDLSGLKVEPCQDCKYEWTVYGKNVTLHVHAYPPGNIVPGKMARAFMHGVFQYGGQDDSPGWHFVDGDRRYKNAEQPPLQRALSWFLNTNKDAWRSASPNRDGMWLPVQVTRVLESVCSSESPFK